MEQGPFSEDDSLSWSRNSPHFVESETRVAQSV